MTGQREHQARAFPEYVENEYTETMWVRRDLAASVEAAIAWIVNELELTDGLDSYDPESVRVVHMRLYPPDHPNAPDEAVHEGADWFMPEPESEHTCAYWEMRP